MEDNIPISQAKYDEMTKRLKYLETDKRQEISLAIKVAKEFGDLSENAEYSAAKDEQVKNEMEIARLNGLLLSVIVIDESTISTKTVSVGTTVLVHDVEFNENISYQIVSSAEVDIQNNKISNMSPIGSALVGHKKGEKVVASTPNGKLEFTILNITK